jgi:hypothetical protein
VVTPNASPSRSSSGLKCSPPALTVEEPAHLFGRLFTPDDDNRDPLGGLFGQRDQRWGFGHAGGAPTRPKDDQRGSAIGGALPVDPHVLLGRWATFAAGDGQCHDGDRGSHHVELFTIV